MSGEGKKGYMYVGQFMVFLTSVLYRVAFCDLLLSKYTQGAVYPSTHSRSWLSESERNLMLTKGCV